MSENLFINYKKQHDSWIIDLKKTSKYLQGIAHKSQDPYIILDSHLAHLIVPVEIVRKIFVLRCSPEILEKRLRNKGFNKKKIAENLLSELIDIIFTEALEKYPSDLLCEIDTTNKNPKEVMNVLIAILTNKGNTLGKIDWIANMTKEKKIAKLLRTIEQSRI
jgi:adenylate kinase